jgi:signal transduction histidine kinase
MTAVPTALIVEDRPEASARLGRLLERPNPAWATKLLPHFKAEFAFHEQEAMDKLLRASDELRPYALVALDLGLPMDEHDPERDDTDSGFRVLEFARGLITSCSSVVITTGHRDRQSMYLARKAISLRADDYILKDTEDEEIYLGLVTAYRLGQERLANAWNTMLKHHAEQRQLAVACGRVADRMARVVSDATGETLARAGDLARLLKQRYLLDPERDHSDPVCAALRNLQRAIIETSRRPAEARKRWSQPPVEIAPIDLKGTLEAVVRDCASGLAHGRIRWQRQVDVAPAPVLTFAGDVEFILRELIVNAVEHCMKTPEGCERELRTSVTVKEGDRICVEIVDSGPRLDDQLCTLIGRGEEFDPPVARGEAGGSADDERAFGLSLARRVAHGIGARLTVKPAGRGNAVTLLLPVMARA